MKVPSSTSLCIMYINNGISEIVAPPFAPPLLFSPLLPFKLHCQLMCLAVSVREKLGKAS